MGSSLEPASPKARASAIETARAEARAAQTMRRSNRLSGAAEAAQEEGQEEGADLTEAATEASLQEDEQEEVDEEAEDKEFTEEDLKAVEDCILLLRSKPSHETTYGVLAEVGRRSTTWRSVFLLLDGLGALSKPLQRCATGGDKASNQVLIKAIAVGTISTQVKLSPTPLHSAPALPSCRQLRAN